MKKYIFLFATLFFVAMLSMNSFAQQFFVYDGNAFNLMIKCNSDRSQVLKVNIIEQGDNWLPCTITDFQSLESEKGTGFLYTVELVNGSVLTFDYYPNSNSIVVTDPSRDEQWTLYRRP